MKEIWKDIKGYEGLYQVSNRGRVKSLKRKVNRNGVKLTIPGKILKCSVFNNGYRTADLWKYNKGYKITVHRLVASHFLPNPKNCRIVNHKDGNKTNNYVSNLEWCTYKHNSKHAYKNNLNRPPINDNSGENNGRSILKEHEVIQIKKDLKNGLKTSEISKKYSIKRSSIYHIKAGNSWKHVTI